MSKKVDVKGKAKERKAFDMSDVHVLDMGQLVPDSDNANKGTEKGDRVLEKSLRKLGLGRSILLDKDNNVIAGNHILQKSAELGLSPKIVTVDVDGDTLVAVRRTDMSLNSKEGRQMAIADNHTAKVGIELDDDILTRQAAEWDIDLSEFEIYPLDFPDYDDAQGGEDSDTFENNESSKNSNQGIIEDEEDNFEIPDEETVKTSIKSGDLFELKGENGVTHRLLCGDSTDKGNIEKLMNGKKANICLTSPPYNHGGKSSKFFSYGQRDETLYIAETDNKTKEEYKTFILEILENINFALLPTHAVVWNVAYNAKSRDDYGRILFSEKNPFSIKETIVWNKGNAINIPQVGIYSRKCEFVFVMSNGDKYHTSQEKGECRWNYWETKIGDLSKVHKATFPIAFSRKAIEEFSFEGDSVFEPFGGTGTTMIAANRLNRNSFLMELEPVYCQIIIDRILTEGVFEVTKNGQLYKN